MTDEDIYSEGSMFGHLIPALKRGVVLEEQNHIHRENAARV